MFSLLESAAIVVNATAVVAGSFGFLVSGYLLIRGD